MRIAAVGDLHAGRDSAGVISAQLADVDEHADVLLLAGDLTKGGDPEEAEVLAGELRDLRVPIVAVLGNHDHHADRPAEVRAAIEAVGVRVLEGEAVEVVVSDETIGVAGGKGFGGGFEGSALAEFGEREMKAFAHHAKERADAIERSLESLGTDQRLLLLHYAPIRETIEGERPEIFPFLGSYLLAEAADRAGASFVLHGHAHNGSEKGLTRGGVNVRNVAQPVLHRPFAVYEFTPGSLRDAPSPRATTRV
jgi:Icc-related predicted phosphoesterase